MDIDLLSRIVKELITDHDKVGLPGLGTFVAEVVPASFSDKGYTINPPYRRLSFHPDNTEADLLVKFYSDSNHVPLEASRVYITEFLSELKQVLIQRKTVIFPGLGRLRATKENNFFFVPDEDLDIYPDGFGLQPVSMKYIQGVADPVDIKLSYSDAMRGFEDRHRAAEPGLPVAGEQSAAGEPQLETLSPDHAESGQSSEPVQPIAEGQSSEPVQPITEARHQPEAEGHVQREEQPGTEHGQPAEPELPAEMGQPSEPGLPVAGEQSAAEEPQLETLSPDQAEPVQPSEPGQSSEPVQPVAEGQSSEPVQPITEARRQPEAGGHVQREEQPGTEHGQPAELEQPVAEGQPAEPGQSSESELTSELEQSSEPDHTEPVQPSEDPSERQCDAAPAEQLQGEESDAAPAELPGEETGVVRRRSRWWIAPVVVLSLAVVALGVFVILAHAAPDFIDSILYTPEELKILNY